MGKNCKNCGETIKAREVIDGKVINTQRRVYCYNCSPFGSGNNKSAKCEAIADEIKINRKKKNKDQYRKYQKGLRRERKSRLIEMFGGECVRCGYNKCENALEFHHIEEHTKAFSLSNLGYTCAWERLVEEAKKCQLICANCHREIMYLEEI